jgi:hypothetical protein
LIKWKPPPLRVFKVNWDAAVESNRGKIGLGMIARDSMGNFVAARGVPIDRPSCGGSSSCTSCNDLC